MYACVFLFSYVCLRADLLVLDVVKIGITLIRSNVPKCFDELVRNSSLSTDQLPKLGLIAL